MNSRTQKILDDAKAFVEQKKAEGWTWEDFAAALKTMLIGDEATQTTPLPPITLDTVDLANKETEE